MPAPTLFDQALDAFRREDAPEARRLAEAASREAPQDPGSRQLAATAAMVEGDIPGAIRLYGEVVRLARSPEEAAYPWTGIGRCHLAREDFEQARRAFQRALSLGPLLPPAHAGLAYALVSLGHHREAEAAARRARELGNEDIATLNTLARSLLAQERLEEAADLLDESLRRDPESPETRLLQANLLKIRGRLDVARKTYRDVVDRTDHAAGWSELAQMKTFEPGDADIAAMEKQLAELETDGSRRGRADLLFALAKAYDDLEEPDRAFEYLDAANATQRPLMPYEPSGDEDRMARIEKLFTRDFIHRFPEGGQKGLKAIFIVSMPRSGSTLMEQMLASHPEINGGGEIEHFARVASELSLKWGADPAFPELDEKAAAADLREAGRQYANLTTSLRLLTQRFTDKSLANFQYVGLIRMMLPDAAVVHMRRHPLATALGLYRQRLARGLSYSYSLEHIARYYRAYARLMRHWREACPEAFIEVFYEALVQNPERELRRVCSHLGVDFDPRVLEYYRTERPVRTASLVQVRQPLSQRGVERHKLYARHLIPAADMLEAEIADYEAQLEQAIAAPVDGAS